MGKPRAGNAARPCPEHIGVRRAPGEVKHLSSQRKRKRLLASFVWFPRIGNDTDGSETIPLVVANERGTVQTHDVKPVMKRLLGEVNLSVKGEGRCVMRVVGETMFQPLMGRAIDGF